MRAASRLLFCCPFFRKGFVSISISDHPLEIFVSLLLLAVGVVVFLTLSLISEVFCFFCLDQLGLRNNFCELVGVVIARNSLSELRKIAIISFGRFVLFLGGVFLSLSLISRVFWFSYWEGVFQQKSRVLLLELLQAKTYNIFSESFDI